MSILGSKKFIEFSKEVFNLDKKIKYFALIDLEGYVLVEDSRKKSSSFVKEDADKIVFYYQVGRRRTKREDFDEVCGETSYVHIKRKKIHQLIVYLPLVTIYLMVDSKMKPNELENLVHKVQKIDKRKINQVLSNILIHGNF